MFFPVSRERKLRVFKSALFFISKNDPKTNFFLLCSEINQKGRNYRDTSQSHSETAVNQNFFKTLKGPSLRLDIREDTVFMEQCSHKEGNSVKMTENVFQIESIIICNFHFQ